MAVSAGDVIAAGSGVGKTNAGTIVSTPWISGSVAVIVAVLVFSLGLTRIPADRVKLPARIEPMAACGLFIAYLVLGGLAGWLVAGWLGLSTPEQLDTTRELALLQLGAYVFMLPVVIAYPFLVTHRASSTRVKALIAGIVVLGVSWPIILGVTGVARWIISVAQGTATDPIAHAMLEHMSTAPRTGWFILLSLLVTVGAGIFEEVAYRGCIQRGLRSAGLPPWGAIIITSAIFTVNHAGVAPLEALIGLFVLSLALGWACERTGRLTAPIIMHILFNAGNLIILIAAF